MAIAQHLTFAINKLELWWHRFFTVAKVAMLTWRYLQLFKMRIWAA